VHVLEFDPFDSSLDRDALTLIAEMTVMRLLAWFRMAALEDRRTAR
jgi:hypothetical protein